MRRKIRKATTRYANKAICIIGKRVLGSDTFSLGDERYHYFWHWYNRAYKVERAVEIPIALRFLEGCDPDRALEVGNVLSHYSPCRHRVVDKYERSSRVINEDAETVSFGCTFDRIAAVSTLEHVGWDEKPKDPAKFNRVVDNLVRHLAPGGTLFATIPLGQNPNLDKALWENRLPFTEKRFLARIPAWGHWLPNRWREVEQEAVRDAVYGSPYPAANALLVGIIQK